ncbi:MAG: hypothetical protein ACPGU6_06730 [Tenacibaculum sp.]
MYKKIIIIIVLLVSINSAAQCAMCKAVVEGGSETMAEGVNDGITYLMVFPYILVGVLAYFIYRHKKHSKN